jgi:hypothetical protein
MTVRVPRDRSVGGLLELSVVDRGSPAPLLVCATATADSGARHPAFGRYVLREVRVSETPDQAEHGPCRLVFEPEAGDALAAEARGVLTLELHGGDTGPAGRLRRTAGGLRLRNDELMRIARLVAGDDDVQLELVPEPLPWWRLVTRWRRRLARHDAAADAAVHDSRNDDRGDPSTSRGDGAAPASSAWSGAGGRFAGAGSGGDWADGRTTVIAAGAAVAAIGAAGKADAAASAHGGDALSTVVGSEPGSTTY